MTRALQIVVVLATLFAGGAATAQQAPRLGYLFPPVLQAGADNQVLAGGFDFTPDLQFFVLDDRLTIEPLGAPGEFLVPLPPYWFGPRDSTPAMPIAREMPVRISPPPKRNWLSPQAAAWRNSP